MDSTLSEDEFWEKRSANSHDDWGGDKTFLEGYRESIKHPHRQLIIDFLKDKDASSLFEIGCCNGPNLFLIRKNYPNIFLGGTDINKEAIKDCWNFVPRAVVDVTKFPHSNVLDKVWGYVLADACLMYIADINKALSEMKRIAKKGIIIFDWETENEEKISYSYTRKWMKRLGEAEFKDIKIRALTEQEWPNEKWQKYGRFITATI